MMPSLKRLRKYARGIQRAAVIVSISIYNRVADLTTRGEGGLRPGTVLLDRTVIASVHLRSNTHNSFPTAGADPEA